MNTNKIQLAFSKIKEIDFISSEDYNKEPHVILLIVEEVNYNEFIEAFMELKSISLTEKIIIKGEIIKNIYNFSFNIESKKIEIKIDEVSIQKNFNAIENSLNHGNIVAIALSLSNSRHVLIGDKSTGKPFFIMGKLEIK